jgi:uroporphyrin-III C-methyltransferase
VVLYDALASEDLLEYCQPTAELIYVGKRGGEKCVSQEYINYLIVTKAQEKGHVVRLKGGDAMVFGRAQEEIDAATAAGVPVQIIPGVSSALAAPTSVGLPLTIRGLADSFWVITGTKTDHSLSHDLQLALQSKATVVLLMAMNKAQQIADWYTEASLGQTPVLIVQEATTASQKQAIGKVADLPFLIEKHQLTNPAVMVIGQVVSYLKKPTEKIYKKEDFDSVKLSV